jgi:hypothetical protein
MGKELLPFPLLGGLGKQVLKIFTGLAEFLDSGLIHEAGQPGLLKGIVPGVGREV